MSKTAGGAGRRTAATMQRTITTGRRARITPVKVTTTGTKGFKRIRNVRPRTITSLR